MNVRLLAVLALTIPPALVTSCSPATPPPEEASAGTGSRADAAKLFVQQQCSQCHGREREGVTGAGPALKGLSVHWIETDLAEYLADPASRTNSDPRLRENAAAFRMPMPRYGHLSESSRLALARWLLAD